MRASAPGKLVLCGEYAVLHGHPAVVASVDVRATCSRVGGPLEIERDAGGLVDACLAVIGGVDAADGRVVVDTGAFRAGNDKYGLGSSAAACVALLSALRPGLQLDELHALAQRAHRNFQQGRGSGIDVCASVFGGFQRYVRRPSAERGDGDDDVIEVSAARGVVDGITLLPVWTGVSADTRAYLQKVDTAPHINWHMDRIGAASERFQRATLPHELLIAVEDANNALLELGQAAGADIVSDVHHRVARVARNQGGAAKPSGAGGGDVALCFVPDDAVDACRAVLHERGFRVLPFALGVPGVDVVGDAA